jgi:hypothetical protein
VWLGPWAQGGALFSYGPDVNLLVLGAAAYVDKILKGAKPADLPVESQDAIADLLLEIARNPYSAHPKVTCPAVPSEGRCEANRLRRAASEERQPRVGSGRGLFRCHSARRAAKDQTRVNGRRGPT